MLKQDIFVCANNRNRQPCQTSAARLTLHLCSGGVFTGIKEHLDLHSGILTQNYSLGDQNGIIKGRDYTRHPTVMMCSSDKNFKAYPAGSRVIAEVNGKCYPVFKNPKEGGFKKSQKGLCYVYEEDGVLKYKDEYTSENIPDGNLLETVFKDGKLIKDYTLNEIRQRLNGGKF